MIRQMQCLSRLVPVALLLAACTSIKVQPIPASSRPAEICIRQNPAVLVRDFVPVIRDRFAYHGIQSRVVAEDTPCEFALTYTARRSWDITPFLSHAEIYLWRDDEQIASGVFHLRGKGGYALTKYDSTKQKMDPVIDQLVGAE